MGALWRLYPLKHQHDCLRNGDGGPKMLRHYNIRNINLPRYHLTGHFRSNVTRHIRREFPGGYLKFLNFLPGEILRQSDIFLNRRRLRAKDQNTRSETDSIRANHAKILFSRSSVKHDRMIESGVINAVYNYIRAINKFFRVLQLYASRKDLDTSFGIYLFKIPREDRSLLLPHIAGG